MGTARPGPPAGLLDWAVAGCVAAVLLITGLSGRYGGGAWPAPAGYALLAAGGLALGLRRGHPVGVLAGTALCTAGYQAAGFDVPAVAFLFAVYFAVRAGHRRAAVAASAALLAGLPLVALATGTHQAGDALAHSRRVLELAWLIAAGAAGEALRQAERRAAEAERTREETARRRAHEERLRIARELHDSLTHQISIIKVQAEVAVHTARKRGERPPPALPVILQAAREASRELRATLQALRDDATGPPRGLADLSELVERARDMGLPATLAVDGPQQEVPAAVGRTVYRIVQEALTNAARHARATGVTVRVECRPEAVTVRVDDDGVARPGADPVPGVGLLGMRERVTALGGRLRAGPREQGGFTVEAELPVERLP
nr:MAG: two-component sensor histidine kinase [Actinomycetota bacterium]